ncbi:dTMP kinase [Minwuia sp.]|uniref:dTMP kinase n=1 Tax=Minwuia sp. TaxID=2493630 RepID=UPI003A918FB1
MRAAHAGIFITFEGGEAAGKTTQIGMLDAYLKRAGHDVVLTREPGGTPLAERLRALLLDSSIEMGAMEQVLLFQAARRNHVDQVIAPALRRGAVVLCDRFSDSTLAYQGAAGGIDMSIIRQLHTLALDGFMPDLTLIFDLPVEESRTRIAQRAEATDRFEQEQLAFHERLRACFLDIGTAEPERCRIIDAGHDVEHVWASIVAEVDGFLAAHVTS